MIAKSSTGFHWLGKGGNVTSAGWKGTLWSAFQVSSHSGEAVCELLYSVYFTLLYMRNTGMTCGYYAPIGRFGNYILTIWGHLQFVCFRLGMPFCLRQNGEKFAMIHWA